MQTQSIDNQNIQSPKELLKYTKLSLKSTYLLTIRKNIYNSYHLYNYRKMCNGFYLGEYITDHNSLHNYHIVSNV